MAELWLRYSQGHNVFSDFDEVFRLLSQVGCAADIFEQVSQIVLDLMFNVMKSRCDDLTIET